jgi:hypothetical protein
MLMGRSEQCSKQSATVVLSSLSPSAREVFRLIAESQLDLAASAAAADLGERSLGVRLLIHAAKWLPLLLQFRRQ